jgi:hypothetical protein
MLIATANSPICVAATDRLLQFCRIALTVCAAVADYRFQRALLSALIFAHATCLHGRCIWHETSGKSDQREFPNRISNDAQRIDGIWIDRLNALRMGVQLRGPNKLKMSGRSSGNGGLF